MENIGRTLSDINHSKILYDLPPRVMEIKTKINTADKQFISKMYKLFPKIYECDLLSIRESRHII